MKSSWISMDSLNQTLRDPLLGTNTSFLRFTKYMRMDLSLNKLQWVFVTLFELEKWKEALINNDGQIKRRELIHFTNKMAFCHHLWTWHLSSFHSVNWVFNLSLNRSNFMSHVTPLSLSKNAFSNVTLCYSLSIQCFQVYCCVVRCSKGSRNFTFAVKTIFVLVPFESVLWLHYLQHSRTLFWVSCHRCGIHHGAPSMRLFLLTSAHHPGNSLRNKKVSTLRSVCLNDRFSHSRHRFTSLTFDR